MSGSMHDDIPETAAGFFGRGCGCIALILIAGLGLVLLALVIAKW